MKIPHGLGIRWSPCPFLWGQGGLWNGLVGKERALVSGPTTPLPRPRGEPQRVVCRVRREGVGTGAPPGEASGDGELQLQWPWVVELVPSLTAAGRRAQPPWAGLAFLRVRLSYGHIGLGPHCSLFGHFAPLPQPLGYSLFGLPWGSATLAAFCTRLPERQKATWGCREVTPVARETLGAGMGGESEWETQQAHRRAGALPQALGEALIWKGSSPGAAVCRPPGSGDRPATCRDHWDVWHVQSPLQAIPGLCGISSQTQVSGVCGH